MMATIDRRLTLAISLHENPGAYALLIGSGVSRPAGIPTGWEIVLDLITKVAAMEGAKTERTPEAWYHAKFGEPPNYSKLLEMLASTPAARMALLRSYFEPNEEERERGLKAPTVAHRAIASLAKNEYIRMILTTNFDRLLEFSLQEQGVTPDVITHADDLPATVPYVLSRCTVVKLHGDYRDTRIRNTPEELAEYAPEMAAFLERIFDDFGLVICGWSADWDAALRNALSKPNGSRFGTYWLARGDLSESSKVLIQAREAEVIPVKSADEFFQDLLEKTQALDELAGLRRLPTAVAVATAKRYIPNPKDRIRLHDLIFGETERAYRDVFSSQLPMQAGEEKIESIFQERMKAYERTLYPLLSVLAAVAHHDQGENSYLLTRCIERLASKHRGDGLVVLLDLQLYPALLAMYVSGVSALTAQRWVNLAAILIRPRIRDRARDENLPAISTLNTSYAFSQSYRLISRPQREYTPASNRIFDILRPILSEYLPSEDQYEQVFDHFEYLLALAFFDIAKQNWVPVGRFGWRYRYFSKDLSPMNEFVRKGIEQGEEWGLLKAGFFENSLSRFEEVAKMANTLIDRETSRWL